MIILYGFGEGFGLPEIGPYVTKTEVQLQLADLAYRKAGGDRTESPKGQVPYIDTREDGEGERIADSTFIRAWLEETHGIDLDAGLDDLQRAQAWAIERMCENQLAWIGAHARWMIPENFARGPARFFDAAPEAFREQIRQEVLEKVRENLLAVGVGRHSEPEMLGLARRSLSALSVILGDKPYLMGDRPCGADATVFGVLAFILTPWFSSDLRSCAESFGNLTAYVDRMMAQFYPDFAWGAGAQREAVAA